MSKYKTVVCVSLFIIILDQITKVLIRSSVALHESISLLPFLDITHLRNRGAAFGILNELPDTVRMPLFVLILVVAVVAIFAFLKRAESRDRIMVISLSLILGGAIGNSIDRFRLRYVTDFIDFHWFGNPKYHWPPFNVADAAITIGVILILLQALFSKKVSYTVAHAQRHKEGK
ncbi:MAG: signal peptidase II [Candidatus Dadabacteria bacterium]|nr:signal peptidase II [Candidatus Dadabacteria bacterium]